MENKLSVSELCQSYLRFIITLQVRGMRTQPWNKDSEGSGFMQSKCLDLKVVLVMGGWKHNNSQDGISCISILFWIWLLSRSAIWWRTWTRSVEDAADVFYCCRFFHFLCLPLHHVAWLRFSRASKPPATCIHLKPAVWKKKKHRQLSNCQYTARNWRDPPTRICSRPWGWLKYDHFIFRCAVRVSHKLWFNDQQHLCSC